MVKGADVSGGYKEVSEGRLCHDESLAYLSPTPRSGRRVLFRRNVDVLCQMNRTVRPCLHIEACGALVLPGSGREQ